MLEKQHHSNKLSRQSKIQRQQAHFEEIHLSTIIHLSNNFNDDNSNSNDNNNKKKNDKRVILTTCNNPIQDANEKEPNLKNISNSHRVNSSTALSEEQIREFEGAMRKLSEATGINDMEEIISKYIEAEDKNFSLFNYVTHELGGDIQRLENHIAALMKDIECVKDQRPTLTITTTQ
mmetsp:Transcript_50488/g.60885  ORF Transcript_50488/g.60885 Transcript_50488/m.60885 type:complete len:177 (+) Transcript_50488:142-672(+)